MQQEVFDKVKENEEKIKTIQKRLDSHKHFLRLDSSRLGKGPKKLSEIFYIILFIKPITYYGNTNNIQCSNDSRSVEDIYRICKHYFPDLLLFDIIEIIKILKVNRLISQSYCNFVMKLVHSRNRYDATKESYAKVFKDFKLERTI